MKKLILLLFIPLVSFGQGSYCDGYKAGWAKAEKVYICVAGVASCGVPTIGGNNYSTGYGEGYAAAERICNKRRLEREEKEREEKRKNNTSSSIPSAQIDWDKIYPKTPRPDYSKSYEENEKFLKSIGWPGYDEEEEEERRKKVEELTEQTRRIATEKSREKLKQANRLAKKRAEEAEEFEKYLKEIKIGALDLSIRSNKNIRNKESDLVLDKIKRKFDSLNNSSVTSISYIKTNSDYEKKDESKRNRKENAYEELKKLKELLDLNILTKTEYDKKASELKKILLD